MNKTKEIFNEDVKHIFIEDNRDIIDNEEILKGILTDSEISKIPETVEYAENLSQINKLKEENKLLNEHIKEIVKELDKFRQKSRTIIREIYNLENGTGNKERKKFSID